jgi:ribosomal protein S18 acetylase RimI-like enzyme
VAHSHIEGFIASSTNCPAFLTEFLLKKGFTLFPSIVGAIIKKPLIVKGLWESIVYARRIAQGPIKAEMLFIAVEPDYRSQGTATQLIKCTLAEMKRMGVEKVKVSTDQSNTVVNNLLQKLGFDFMSTFQLYGKKMCLYNRRI